ncbi:MAG: NUDIX hydrolase [Patescibacteria group bacterium]
MPQLQLFKVAVSAFIVKDGRLLILKRRDDEEFLPGVWEVPGGGVDEGEAVPDAVIRETKEEAGIDIKVEQLFGYFEYIDGFGQKTVNLNFIGTMNNPFQEPDVSLGEMEKFAWVGLDELKNYKLTSDTMLSACEEALKLS